MTARELADRLVEVQFEADPFRATLLGFRERDAELPDLSDAAERALAERLREVADEARRFDREGLSEDDRLTLDIVALVAEEGADTADVRWTEWQITDLPVAPASAMLTFLPMTTVADATQAEAYVARLRGMGDYLDAAADRHVAGIAAGRSPVARLVRAAVAQIDGYLAAPGQDPLRNPLATAEQDTVRDPESAAERVLEDVVRPAYARYRDRLAAEVEPRSRDDEHPGLCWLPDGEHLYATVIRTFTTTTREPQDLHDTGMAVLAGLAAEYAELGGRVFGETDPAAVMLRLRDDPALRCTSAADMLAEAERAVARAEAALPAWFGRRPAQSCLVRPVPEVEAARAPLAYYLPGALDGSRAGTYWQNTGDPTGAPRHILQCTAFHEAVPGHHLQIALAQEQPELPLLRRIAEFGAFDEGWGLYSERLADEMGLYTDDLARLGMLTADSLRASRLVVDTGIHALGWSRARAVEFLRANTPLPAAGLDVEIDRYIAVPGQALAYLVGRLEIQRLRAEAERALGDGFDVRAFHDVVLGAGALPLPILADLVGQWSDGKAAARISSKSVVPKARRSS